MKKNDKLFEAFKKQSLSLKNVNIRGGKLGITHRPVPTHYEKNDTMMETDQE